MTSRRDFLRYLGGALSLPLWAMPGRALADAAPPQRFVVLWVPNGWRNHLWLPSGQGSGWTLSPIMQPLEAVRDKVLCVSGLDNRPGVEPVRFDEHSACTRASLTCSHPDVPDTAPHSGWSVDQLIAEAIGRQNMFPSLEVGSEEPLRCYTPNRCPGFETIAWRGRLAPMIKDTSLVSIYTRLFGGLQPGLTTEERVARLQMERSLLDGLSQDIKRYTAGASVLDQRRLEQYTSGLRDLERRLDLRNSVAACGGASDVVAREEVEGRDPTGRLHAMADVITLALQCDRTRVVTWMLGTGRSERSMSFLGVDASHHELSHAKNWDDGQTTVGQWEVGQLVYFIERLASVPEGDGTLLDNTTVLFLAGIGESTTHDPLDMSVLLAGGRLSGLGERRVAPAGSPLAGLYLDLLGRFGVSQRTFGDDGEAPLGLL